MYCCCFATDAHHKLRTELHARIDFGFNTEHNAGR